MKSQLFFFFTLALLVHHVYGANEPTPLDTGSFTFVSLTPTNVILKTNERGDVLRFKVLDQVQFLKANTEFTIPLDKEVKILYGDHV